MTMNDDELLQRQLRELQLPDQTGCDVTSTLDLDQMLRQMADQFAKRVDEQTALLWQERERLRLIHEISQTTSSILDEPQLLAAASQKICEAFGYCGLRIWLVTGGELVAATTAGGASPNGKPPARLPLSPESVPGWVAAHVQPLLVPDAHADRRCVTSEELCALRAELAVPLVIQDQVAGVLDVQSDQPGAFDQNDLATLQTLASQLAVALHNARLFRMVERGKQEWEKTFDAIAEGVILHDHYLFTILRTNWALARMLDMTPKALVGRSVHEVVCGCAAPECALAAALRSGQAAFLDLDHAARRRSYHASLAPVLGPDGEPRGGVLVLRDTTQERLWQARLLQSEKLASLGQLAAGVAHEINNPLGFITSNLNTLSGYLSELETVIAGYRRVLKSVVSDQSSVIRDQWSPGRGLTTDNCSLITDVEAGHDVDFLLKDFAQAIAESREGVGRVREIVLGLKNFARADETREMKDADLHEGLESTLKIVWNELKYKATVARDYGELPPVRCHPARLNQVFMNLLVNAAQAIEDHGQITLRTRAEGEWVAVSVADTGCGIPPENLPRLFDPFFTTKDIGVGTGLGLSVAFGIVQEHGGRIEVESEVGRGTVFTVKLPIER